MDPKIFIYNKFNYQYLNTCGSNYEKSNPLLIDIHVERLNLFILYHSLT
jgi:hypothetical protein